MSDLDVKFYWKKLKLSQSELAAKLGVSRNTVINYEKGKVIPESKKELLRRLLEDTAETQTNRPNIEIPQSVWEVIELQAKRDNQIDELIKIIKVEKGGAVGVGVVPKAAAFCWKFESFSFPIVSALAWLFGKKNFEFF